tara:strand:- start:10812 stop:11429 length:618 start_codon:yes stop_codon:yes gene_type:complete
MKKYNQVFTCEFSVNQLADKLLKSYPITEKEEKESMTPADIAISQENDDFYTRVVESIVDAVADNGTACAHIFNTLNGWVKTETPMDRKETVETVEQIETSLDIQVDSIVIFQVSDENMEKCNNKPIDVKWIEDRDRELVGKVVRCKDSGDYKVFVPCIRKDHQQGHIHMYVAPEDILATRDEDFYHVVVNNHLPQLVDQLNGAV